MSTCARGKQVLPSPPPPPPHSPATRSSVLKNAQGEVRRKAISTVATSKNTATSFPFTLKEPPESIIEASGDSGIAAAATTLVYKLQYGKDRVEDLTGRDDSSEDESDASVSLNSEGSGAAYVPRGVEFSDDDILLDVDSEEDDLIRSSFPRDRSRRNKVLGGPQKPDLCNCTESEAQVLMKRYRAARKAFTDKQRLLRVKADRALLSGSSASSCSGVGTPALRPMKQVEESRLLENQVFLSKEILQLRIAEEANLRGISTHASRSDHTTLTTVGFKFYVHATFSEKNGWTVHSAVCREGDDILKIPPKDVYDGSSERKIALRTPLKSKWAVPYITKAVLDNPTISYQMMRELMKPYANDYALTDSILQDARDAVKEQLFGSPANNVLYAKGVAEQLRKLGHEVEFTYTDRRKTLKKALAMVLSEEAERRLKKNNESMDHQEQQQYIKQWKVDNEVYIDTVFGMEDGPQLSFLTGILFAPSSSRHMVPLLQDVVQADGAHTSFGMYTLYSAYGTTANGNMAPICFGILYGNEDTENWSKFWTFVRKIHPSIDCQTKTILSDQDKGLTAAISNTLPRAAPFICSFHRRQNIISKCGGGKGTTPLSALWMFNLLCSSNSVKQIADYKAKYLNDMHPRDTHYLEKLPDQCQYPAARCAMGDNICMFSKSASSGVESMNRANHLARERTAVDIVNAVILILKLEGKRFDMFKQEAWTRDDQVLTEQGLALMEEAFKDVDVRNYQMNVMPEETCHRCTVSRTATNNQYTVTIPMVEDSYGSRFGTCTCGKPKKDGVPCQHMVTVVKAMAIDGLSRVKIMPYWWTTALWREQYAADEYCRTDVSLDSIKATYHPDDKLRYCPEYMVAKKGRPKTNARKKSVADHIEESSKKKRKRRKKMFCTICHKFNHSTPECFNNPLNQQSHTSKQKEGGMEVGTAD
jgi:hypothetical protein